MATALRILCVHGVGQHPPGGAWQQAWEAAIHEACRQVDAERALDIQYCHYDDIFAQHTVGLGDTLARGGRWLGHTISPGLALRLDGHAPGRLQPCSAS